MVYIKCDNSCDSRNARYEKFPVLVYRKNYTGNTGILIFYLMQSALNWFFTLSSAEAKVFQASLGKNINFVNERAGSDGKIEI